MKVKKLIELCACFICLSGTAHSQAIDTTAQRPTILSNRWQEDWSVLEKKNVPREPLDSLKYISLSATDPKTYLSFGAGWRNRYENNNALDFGVKPDAVPQSYIITRMEVDADLHVANQLQAFVQLQNDYAPGKEIILPVDQDRLDLEQGFLALVEPVGAGLLKLRAGRQQMAFDMQRFISVRNGPNVRQSYDALWGDYETEKWRYISFYSHPVISRNIRCFDDYSSSDLIYWGVRVERKITDAMSIASYLSFYRNVDGSFPSVSGDEYRNIVDIRIVSKSKPFDWDFETMGQTGDIATKNIRAWAIGSVSGYTFENLNTKPRLGLQVDAASGNPNQNSHTLRTFNPLFPNGEYFTLAGYTGYTNLIHIKPSLTFTLSSVVKAMFAFAGQWRETTGDAVYVQPDNPVPGTVGLGGRFTGTYLQTRFDWQMMSHIHNAIELVHFNVANAVRKVGGHDSTYAGLEVKMDW